MCDGVEVYESLEISRIYNDAATLENIIQDTIKIGFQQDEALEYAEQFVSQVVPPGIAIVVFILLLVVVPIYLCCNPTIRLFNRFKGGCRIFYLVTIGVLVVLMSLLLYFSGSIQNSMLSGSCQFEGSRMEAESVVTNLQDSVMNITNNLDIFVGKVTSSLGATPPSTLLTSYTISLDDLYDYNTADCYLPECLILGQYYCPLCLNAEPVQLIGTFLQNTVNTPIQETEQFLNSIDTNFVQAKDGIQAGLNSVSDIRSTFLGKEGAWGTSAASAIDFSAELNPWYSALLFVLLVAGIGVSIMPAERDYPRINCIGCLVLPSIIIFLLFGAVFVPLVTVSNDLCAVIHDIPNKIPSYYEIDGDTLDIITQCFGDGTLPEKYLSPLDFVDTIGDCPTYNVQAIFDGIPSGSLNVLVDTMNSFTTSDINNQLNPVYKQRMIDIMEIKRLNGIATNREQQLKDATGTAINNVVQICGDIKPLFDMVRKEIYDFSCQIVGKVYYTTVNSFCGLVDSTQNFTIVIYLLAFIATLFYIGTFGYFVSSLYSKAISREERVLIKTYY